MIPTVSHPWIVLVLACPLLVPLVANETRSVLDSIGVLPRLGGHEIVILTSILALGYSLTDGIVVDAEPWFALFLPAGFLLYRLEDALWTYASGRPVANPSVDARALLPIFPAAIAEEVVFRAALSPLLADGVLPFVATSAIAFGAFHLPDVRETFLKSVDGTIYALLYAGSGTVVVPIFAHLGFNLGYLSRVSTASTPGAWRRIRA